MAVVFTIIIITAFYLTVRTMLRQKKLSEIKNDFINNMTHEFKTPISTISDSSEMLRREQVSSDPEKVKRYANIIFDIYCIIFFVIVIGSMTRVIIMT